MRSSANLKKTLPTTTLGLAGEYYVLYRLALLGITGIKLNDNFNFDILTNEDIRIEVKTARKRFFSRYRITEKHGERKYGHYGWEFLNKRTGRNYKLHKVDRKCDFFILLCLNEDYSIDSCYIVPKKVVGKRMMIRIGTTTKHRYAKYNEKWDLIK